MDFARKQLEKYGWSDGKGLGKHENGISEALKVKLKRSVTGVGHNAAADFTEHWWTTLYDKAASNIEVQEKNGRTKQIKAKEDNSFQITTDTWKLKRSKPKHTKPQEQYEEFFIRTAVLGSGGSRTDRVRESESESEEEIERDVKMTDEELFAACGGRTAHKGARHGLKALGKLARIEKQEQLLLQHSKFNGYSHAKNKQDKDEESIETLHVPDEVTGMTKKKKKKKKHCLKQENLQPNDLEDTCTVKKKKKKIKNDVNGEHKLLDNTDVEDVKIDFIDSDKEVKVKESKKVTSEDDDLIADSKKSKKRKKQCLNGLNVDNCDMEVEVRNGLHKKSKKRRQKE